MFGNLLKFEWLFINRKLAFYANLLFYPFVGLMMGTTANFPFPNTLENGTYIPNFIMSVISLVCIFSTTILAAQTLFRERDAGFEAILYTTPLRKIPYVLSRFSIIFLISVACYMLFTGGLMTGHLIKSATSEVIGAFRIWNYIQPFLILLLPNIIFCTAVACSIGLLTRNKMLVYVSGIFIYFLYWGVSFYTDSPLVANSAPVSAESLKWAALTDPFGIAGFFEQTHYWTAWQRNNQLVQLKGYLLINRLIYLGVSAVLLLIAYRKFTFTLQQDSTKNKRSARTEERAGSVYRPVATLTASFSYDIKCLYSLVAIECRNIIKSIPIWVIVVGWLGFLGIDIGSNITGTSRTPEEFATTGAMIKFILTDLPLVALMVLLFYGNEISWRSHQYRFNALQNTTPVKAAVLLFSKWVSLIFIIVVLLVISIVMCVVIQLALGTAPVDWTLYSSLFYLIGLPLSLCAGLIICIQSLIMNRYAGIVVAGILILLTNTSAGIMFGIRHPLLQFANTFQGNYSEMNGFGIALIGFSYKMIYWTGVSGVIFILAATFSNKARLLKLNRRGGAITVLMLSIAASVISGITIFNRTNIRTNNAVNDWQQSYEEHYAFLKKKPQPDVVEVKTAIDLYPSKTKYEVKAVYTLLNRSDSAIDTLYMNGDKKMNFHNWTLENGQLIQSDTEYGYYIFQLKKPLQPGDSTMLTIDFGYQASAFNVNAAFNSIIGNGSFIRISDYYPRPGYNSGNEIDDPTERKKRKMPAADSLLLPEDPKRIDHDFIRFDAVISTDSSQTAIGIGELEKEWTNGDRRYFHYYSATGIPFRFAVASAEYAVKKIQQRNTTIEVYYHPGHAQNIGHIVKMAAQSLDYCEEHFGEYPHRAARFIEISSFTRGIAGTAYPGSLFINESFGYQNKIDGNPGKDILNELVSHELSHTWWGIGKIAPDYRKGSRLMTETLAMYSELMIYKKVYGEQYLLSRVNVHKSIYLGNRGDADEEPLYQLDPVKIYLPYDKGMVVMYQLYKLLGEQRINKALKSFYDRYTYPNLPPVSLDLLNELYAVASPAEITRINELFKQVVTYDVIVDSATSRKDAGGGYKLEINATINKYREDGKGKSVRVPFNDVVAVAVYFADGKEQQLAIKADKGIIKTSVVVLQQPEKVVIDPEGILLNRLEETKSKQVTNQ
jgi:ABC-2 type transport system permease protein